MKKVLFVAPHLSTGGMPQYTYDLMRKIKDDVEVYCIEYSMNSSHFIVQRNRIIELLGDKFFELGEDKNKLIDIIETLKPDIVHLQEVPEYFMSNEVADQLYSTDRDYIIVETSHDSSFPSSSKRYFPDHFALISEYQRKEFSSAAIGAFQSNQQALDTFRNSISSSVTPFGGSPDQIFIDADIRPKRIRVGENEVNVPSGTRLIDFDRVNKEYIYRTPDTGTSKGFVFKVKQQTE